MPLPHTSVGYMSLGEVAKRWGVSPDTVISWYVQKQNLRGTFMAGRWFFTVEEVERFEELLKKDWKSRVKAYLRKLKRLDTPLEPDVKAAAR